jgi:hypothetical protein
MLYLRSFAAKKNADVNRNADEHDTDTGNNEIAMERDSGEEK